MKGERVKQLFKKASVKAGVVMLAAALAVGGSVWVDHKNRTPLPELVTFVDSEGTVSITEEEVPLATPKVTVSTKTSKKTKKIKMKKASKKTYSKKQSKKKTTTKQSASSAQTTTTKTVTATNVVNQYKKGSKINTQVTTVKTTVTKTVVKKDAASNNKSRTEQQKEQTAVTVPTNASLQTAAPMADPRVINAFETLGFTVTVNPKVSYAGYFDARTRSITLKDADDTIYHELGHFVAFVAGNADRSAAFMKVFEAEKANYTAFNKAYVLSSSSEYFAESFKNYTQNPAELQASRPQTYAAISAALNAVTNDHVTRIANLYSSIWK